MVSTEDERVVSLSFDNKNFEKHAKESMSTLDKLKEKLSFNNIKDESASALKSLLGNVETIASKSYSIVDRTIDKIKDSISSKIVSTIRGVTIEPLSTGWTKFGEKTRSVGTLVSQGYGINTVNEQLEKLNTFTDETSYNFTDMVGNIAKFTAAGQTLEDSVTAMMGIANWAALSGQNAQVASSAMYQLSQALSAGAMRREDWRSIQTYNMDTREFRQQALEAGVAMGTLQKTAEGTYQALTGKKQTITLDNFVNTMTENAWFTKEVMLEVYGTYGSAFEKINNIAEEEDMTFTRAIHQVELANEDIRKEFSELTGLQDEQLEKELVAISKIEEITDEVAENFAKTYNIADVTDARNRLEKYTKYIAKFGIKAIKAAQEARTLGDVIDSLKDATSTSLLNIYESIFGDYERAKSLWTDLANNMFDFFQPLWDLQEAFQDWGKGENATQLGGRDDLFRGLYAIGSAVKTIYEGIVSIFAAVRTNSALDNLLSISLTVRNLGYEFYDFVRRLTTYQDIWTSLGEAANNITYPFKKVIQFAKETFKEVFPITRTLDETIGDLVRRFTKFTEIFVMSDSSLTNLRKGIKGIWSGISILGKIAFSVWNSILSPLINSLFNGGSKIMTVVLEIFGSIGECLTYVDEFVDISGIVESIANKVSVALSFVGEVFHNIANELKDIFNPEAEETEEILEDVEETTESIFNGGTAFKNSKLYKRLKEFAAKIKDMFSGIETFKEIFAKYKTGNGFFNFVQLIMDLLDNLVQRVGLTVDAFIEAAKVLSENPTYQKLVGVFEDIWTGVKWLYTNLIKPLCQTIFTTIKVTVLDIYGLVSQGKIEEAMAKINSVLKGGILYRLWKTLSGVKTILGANGILSIVKNVSGVLKSTRKYIDAQRLNVYSDALMKFVKAVVVLLGVLMLLTLIPEDYQEKMWDSFKLIGVLMLSVAGAMFAIALATRLAGSGLTAVAVIVLGLFGTFAAIFGATLLVMKQLETKGDSFNKALDTVKGIFDHIVIVIEAIMASGFISGIGGNLIGSKKKDAKGKAAVNQNPVASTLLAMGVLMIGISFALVGFVKAAKELDGLTIDQALSAAALVGVSILAVSAATALIMKALQTKDGVKNASDAKTGLNAALAMIGMTASVALVIVPLIESLSKAENVDWKSMWATLGFVAATMLAISGSFFVMNVATKSSFMHITALVAFVGVTLALRDILIPAVKSLAESKWDIHTENLIAVGAFMLGLALVIRSIGAAISLATENTGELNARKILAIGIVVSGFTALLALVVIPALNNLKDTNWGGVAQYAVVMVSTFASIIGAIFAINALIKNKNETQTKQTSLIILSIAALLLSIGASLVPALKELIDVSWDKYGMFMAVVVPILAGILVGLGILGKQSNLDNKKILAILLGITSIMLSIGLVLIPSLNRMTNGNYKMKLTACISIFAFIGEILAGLIIINKSQNTKFKSIVAIMSGLVLIMVAIHGVIESFSKLTDDNVGGILAATVPIFVTIAAIFAGVTTLLKVAQPDTSQLIVIFAGLTGVMLSVFAVIEAMKHITKSNALGVLASSVPLVLVIVSILHGMTKLFKAGDNVSWPIILSTLTGLSFIFLVIGTAVIPALAEVTSNGGSIRMLMTGVVVAGLIAVLVFTLSQIGKQLNNSENLGKAVLSNLVGIVDVIAVLTALALTLPSITEALNSLTDVDTSKIWAIGGTIAIILAVAGVIAKLAAVNFLAVAAGIAIIVFSLTALLGVILSFKAKAAGNNISDQIIEGYEEGMDQHSPSRKMAKLGKFTVMGLEKGIKSESRKLSKYGNLMGDSIDAALCKNLGIASPSKVMYENGKFVVVGLANGMSSYEGKKSLSDASNALGNVIGSSVGDAVSDAFKDEDGESIFKGLFDGSSLEEAVDKFINGEDEDGKTAIQKAGGKLAEGLKDNLGLDKDASIGEIGKQIVDNIGGSISGYIGEKIGSADANDDSILGTIGSLLRGDKSLDKVVTDMGTSAVTGLTDGLQSPGILAKIEQTGTTIGNSIVDGVSAALYSGAENIPIIGRFFKFIEDEAKSTNTHETTTLYSWEGMQGTGKVAVNTGNGKKVLMNTESLTQNITEDSPLWEVVDEVAAKKAAQERDDAVAAGAKYYRTAREKFTDFLDMGINNGILQLNKDGYYDFVDSSELDLDASYMAYLFKHRLKEEFGIESPSKWMRDEIVGNLIKAFPAGFNKYGSIAENSIDKTMETLKSDISDDFRGLDLLADPNYKVKTTLVPMIDTSEIQNRTIELNDSLNHTTDVTAKLSDAISNPASENISTAELVAAAINGRFDDLIAAVYGSASQTDVNVNINGNKDKIFDAVVEKTKQHRLQTGRAYQF